MLITFQYADELLSQFPELRTRAIYVGPIDANAEVSKIITRFYSVANGRLSAAQEGEFPEIKAWRGAFTKMGLKPTQYRCASEALLRRFRKEGNLPRLHPLIDLCNAISMAYAIPLAVFDAEPIMNGLKVMPATGEEVFEAFSGDIEKPEAGEIIFADAKGRAHARRWTNRQSGYSAIRTETKAAFIVAEALHPTATVDLESLIASLEIALDEAWPGTYVASVQE